MWRLLADIILIRIGAKDDTGEKVKEETRLVKHSTFWEAWSNCGLNCVATDSILKILLILNCKLMYEMYLNVLRAILEKDSWLTTHIMIRAR